MKSNKIENFNEHQENLNMSDVTHRSEIREFKDINKMVNKYKKS